MTQSHRQGTPWTVNDEQFLRDADPKLTAKELATALNRSVDAIKMRRYLLGLPPLAVPHMGRGYVPTLTEIAAACAEIREKRLADEEGVMSEEEE